MGPSWASGARGTAHGARQGPSCTPGRFSDPAPRRLPPRSNGQRPTCPTGAIINPNGLTNTAVKTQCVYCPTGTKQTAASSSGPFTCAPNCPAGTTIK
jgi:hypothetical protein